jgi:branched-chain amino acid transport system permease protein
MMGVLNFAHASLYMIGAYLGYQFSLMANFWVGLFLAPVVVGFLGVAIERYMLRRVHRFGHIPELLLTFGLAFMIEEVVKLVWGKSAVPYKVPEALDFTLFQLFNTSYPAYRMFMLVVAVFMFVLLYLMLAKTRIGMIVQAAITHPEIVGTLGHNVPRVFMLVFGVGSGLAGLAGAIMGNAYLTQPGMAFYVGPIIFVVVVVGGLGSVTGAFIASILIGLIDTFAVAIEYSTVDLLAQLGIDVGATSAFYEVLNIKISDTAGVLPFLLMLVVLVVKPTGLMGQREI